MPIAYYFFHSPPATLLLGQLHLLLRSPASWPSEPGFCLYVSVGALGGTLLYDYFR